MLLDFGWILLLMSNRMFFFVYYLPVPKFRTVWPDWMMIVLVPPLQWQMVLSPRRYLIPTYHPNQRRGRQEIQGTKGRSAENPKKILQIPSCLKDLHPCSLKVKPFPPHICHLLWLNMEYVWVLVGILLTCCLQIKISPFSCWNEVNTWTYRVGLILWRSVPVNKKNSYVRKQWD